MISKINFLQSPKIVQFRINSPIGKNQASEIDVFDKTSESEIFTPKLFEGAKKIVMKTILLDKPQESLAILMNNQIVHYENGDDNSVGIDESTEAELLLKNSNNKIAIVHSHPNFEGLNFTTPLSFDDFEYLNDYQSVKMIYAINSKGEYSMLKKTNTTRPSKEKISEYKNKFLNSLIESLEGEDKDILIEYVNYAYNNKKGTNSELEEKYNKLCADENCAKRMAYAIHNFWLAYSSDLGVNYDTNYSYLK